MPVSQSGLAVRQKQKGLGSIPLRLSFLFKKAVVCGHCLVTFVPHNFESVILVSVNVKHHVYLPLNTSVLQIEGESVYVF